MTSNEQYPQYEENEMLIDHLLNYERRIHNIKLPAFQRWDAKNEKLRCVQSILGRMKNNHEAK